MPPPVGQTRGVGRDWAAWHEPYDEPGSYLAQRLLTVQRLIADALDAAPAGPVRAVSICAGQGRDLVGALARHARRPDVSARLVELDPRNADVARARCTELGLAGIEVVTGDAASTGAYAGAVPADLVLACGLLGNVTDDDVRRTVELLPCLCAPGATVLWTRHRIEPDLTPTLRRWFRDAGFDEVEFVAPTGFLYSVGAHRLRRSPRPLPDPPERMFTFVGADALLGRGSPDD
jgi:hypothetical protein